MNPKIVHSERGITIIGDGPVNSTQITNALQFAPVLVAADGGASRALDLGFMPDMVIGDMDSLQPEVASKFPPDKLHKIPDQDTTDFEKCLALSDAPIVVAVGMMGGRVDHELAAFNALAKFASKNVILLGERDVCFLCPAHLTLDLPFGTRVSLFPFGQVSGQSDGLEWPIEGLEFAPGAKIGTSNRTSEQSVTLAFDEPLMLVILPARCLANVVAALT